MKTVALPDRDVVLRSHKVVGAILRGYFRATIVGMERVPSGQTILVAHHDGGVLPINALALATAWIDTFGVERPLYALAHEILHSACRPFSKLLLDSGVIPADRETMDAALATGESVLVLPGAARETFRTYWHRRDIDLGGRTGFVAQAIRWSLPITPVVTAGSHETVIVLARGQRLAKALGIPKVVRSADVLPILLGVPWGIWAVPFLPQFPLPAKVTTEVLEPIWLPDALGRALTPADAEDPEIVKAGYDLVLSRMRTVLDRLYDARTWPVLG